MLAKLFAEDPQTFDEIVVSCRQSEMFTKEGQAVQARLQVKMHRRWPLPVSKEEFENILNIGEDFHPLVIDTDVRFQCELGHPLQKGLWSSSTPGSVRRLPAAWPTR
eukprot:2428604-Pyramimonas_sp.AAC.1